jgi:hypothetical protein
LHDGWLPRTDARAVERIEWTVASGERGEGASVVIDNLRATVAPASASMRP